MTCVQVVSNYKYHVKMVPGTQKKGKAYRQAVELVTAGRKSNASSGPQSETTEQSTINEKNLIQQVPEMDGINAMLGGVKLQVAGLQKMQQAKKKAKKKDGKKK